MSSYKNFQSDNKKNTANRSDVNNPEFNPTVSALGETEKENFNRSLNNYIRFVSWARWYPDLFLDLIKPKTGGITLDLDQRIFLRSLLRFVSTYGVFPRGYGKTFIEALGMFIVSIFFPNVELALTAQTKQNAAELLKAKYNEIIKYYPILKNEIMGNPKFSKDDAEVNFMNNGRIDILANSKSSLGQRRKRINVEESNIVDKDLFDNVITPIVEVPRLTCGKLAIRDPEELNQQINYFTTTGFRGSDEHIRTIQMCKNMINLTGDIVLGSNWLLPCWYGRGSSKSQIFEKKKKMSPIAFAQNYEEKWVGNVDGALVSINKVLKLRNLSEPKNKGDSKYEYVLGVDVARSQNTANNQSSVAVFEIHRNSNHKIIELPLVNLYTISNAKNFTTQSLEIKRIKNKFGAKMVICDSNGLGVGLIDALMKETFDPDTGENLGCWDTINTDAEPEISGAERCIYDLKPQSAQSNIIVNFIDVVESGKMRLLEKHNDIDYEFDDRENYVENILPFIQTDFLIEEISNLQLKTLPKGGITIERVNTKYNKDRFSAVAYGAWYIINFEDNYVDDSGQSDLEFLAQFAMF